MILIRTWSPTLYVIWSVTAWSEACGRAFNIELGNPTNPPTARSAFINPSASAGFAVL
jgi:hypothetical protein